MRKEHPISYTPEMIIARQEGRKSVTRRIILPQPEVFDNAGRPDYSCLKDAKRNWQVGDLLRIKEGWRCTGGGTTRNIIYEADGDTAMSYCGVDDGRESILHVAEPYWAEWDRLVYKTYKGCDWRSPMFMPKWVARSWDEIVSVRIERLWDITEEDAIKEGIYVDEVHGRYQTAKGIGAYADNARLAFRWLWDSINAIPKPIYKTINGKKQIIEYVSYPWVDIQEEREYRGKLWHVIGKPWVRRIEFKEFPK